MRVRASKQAIRKAKEALSRKGWNDTKLLEIAKSRNQKLHSQQRSNFFNGKVVEDSTAYKIGFLLDLTWEDGDLEPELGKKKQDKGSDIDELVQEVRSRACEKIKTVHGTMWMLRVNRSVPVDDIYIELNVLEQVSCDRTFSDWRRDFQPDWRSFDRLGLGRAIEEGVPALDIVREYPKLMVFGKPGSGKTTFLKSLATRCIDIERQLQWHQNDYVPIFITLKSFAKDARKRGKFSLFDYIYQREFCSWGEKNQQVLESILEQGRALVLLDGLDEAQGQDYEPVFEEVESFCEYFHSNRFLITCRTQSQRYKFEGFTDVEVADFKPEQVNRFIKRWFAVVVDNAESDNLALELIGQLQQPENQQIAELAVTPVLLNLICFVFRGGKGNLPKNRADLYKKGLRDLLEGLDESKGVQREPAYEELTPEAKEKLLTYLAATLFEANDYFPEQETLEKLISERLQISRSKANKVLKSIEEQSGLIVERSEGFWSFSHLTFQEYLTAQHIYHHCQIEQLVTAHLTNQHIYYYSQIEQLVTVDLTNERWEEVFLLVAGLMRRGADELLLLMEKETQQYINTPKLQTLLTWADRVTARSEGDCKPAVKRAAAIFIARRFNYYDLDCEIALSLACVLDSTLDRTFERDINRDFALLNNPKRDPNLDFELVKALDSDYALTRVFNLALGGVGCKPKIDYKDRSRYVFASVLISAIQRELLLIHELEEVKIFQDINFKYLITRLKALQANVISASQLLEVQGHQILVLEMEVYQEFVERIYQTWLEALNLSLETINLSEGELAALQNYFHANWLIVKCNEEAVQVPCKTWEGIEERMLLWVS